MSGYFLIKNRRSRWRWCQRGRQCSSRCINNPDQCYICHAPCTLCCILLHEWYVVAMLHAACVYFLIFDSPAVSVRVRDINDAFTELGRMVALHMALERPLTKLAILQHAVTLISELERKVQGRSTTQLGSWFGGGFCRTTERFRHLYVSATLLAATFGH